MPNETAIGEILNGYAVAVVYVDDLPEGTDPAEPDESGRLPKFVVHPHVEEIDVDDDVLLGYLNEIHGGRTSLPTSYPGSQAFASLVNDDEMRAATVQLAQDFAERMGRSNANRGIVFGARYTLPNGTESHGILKVDLNPDQRFHFATEGGDSWSLEQVSDILPPPKQDVAKYVISPQPGGDAEAGMLDATQGGRDRAADYLLNAVELTVPRATKTRAQVAIAAAEAGVHTATIHERLQEIDEDLPTTQVFSEHFPEVSEQAVEKVVDADSPRPMSTVVADDPYKRVYKSRGRMTLEVMMPDVDVQQVDDRELRIRLPVDAEPITVDYR